MLHAHFATSGGTLRTAYYGDEELRAGVYPGHEEPLVGRCRLTPGCPCVDHTWFQRVKLKYDEPLSSFAFNFDLRRYTLAESETDVKRKKDLLYALVGWCSFTLSNPR